MDSISRVLTPVPTRGAEEERAISHYCDGHSIDAVFAVGATGSALPSMAPIPTESAAEHGPPPGARSAGGVRSRASTAAARRSMSAGARGLRLVVSLPGPGRGEPESLETGRGSAWWGAAVRTSGPVRGPAFLIQTQRALEWTRSLIRIRRYPA